VIDSLNDKNFEPILEKEFYTLPIEKLNFCFSANSMEEIFARLEEEGSQWSLNCLQNLKKKSPLALKLTLRLIREGENSDWKGCLQREFRVASRRILDEEF
jgi:enoyl-CoA hydratase/carnithine racemase